MKSKYTKDRNGLIVLPTGSGKSVVIAAIIKALDAPVLILQPSKEILEQNYNKLCSDGVMGIGIYAACMNRKEICRVTYAMIGSIRNVKEKFLPFRFCLVDECHNVNAQEGMYKELFDYLGCKVLGLTATPYRLYSSLEFGSILKFLTRTKPRIFTDVIYHVQVAELRRQGFLADMKYYQINLIDQRRLVRNSTGADFTDRSVQLYYAQINFAEELRKIVERLLTAGRTRILVFTRFTQEAEYVKARCSAPSAIVTGETPKKEREQILKDFKAKRINVVTNVGVLTTGFDYPELDTVVMARPTMSLALWYQICGRAIRPSPGKESWIVDLCGNYKRFGRVEDLYMSEPAPRQWIIEGLVPNPITRQLERRQLTNIYFSNT